jgi:hypothetical protein
VDLVENRKSLLKYCSYDGQEMKMGTGGGTNALIVLAGKPRKKRIVIGTASGRIRENIRIVLKDIINVTQIRDGDTEQRLVNWFRFQNYRPRQSFRITLYFEAFNCNSVHLFTLTPYSPCTPYKN